MRNVKEWKGVSIHTLIRIGKIEPNLKWLCPVFVEEAAQIKDDRELD